MSTATPRGLSALRNESIVVITTTPRGDAEKPIHHRFPCHTKGQYHWETNPSSFSLQHQGAVLLRNPSITMFPATPRGNIEKPIQHHLPCNAKGKYWETYPSPCFPATAGVKIIEKHIHRHFPLQYQGEIISLKNTSNIIFLAKPRGDIIYPATSRGDTIEKHITTPRGDTTEKHIHHHFSCNTMGQYH